ncbi:YuiB family protein [Shouchella shacheensis]|uniref:YuiB family protein n=1 Tax=Shouchella shacheensis TaxID=1649580 RepID=UPI00073FD2A2|nr:YuiB family protein [Shouchella shacheensis]
MNIVQFVISILLFLVLFFGIGFLLNMVLRATWVMAFIYPIIILFIVNDVPYGEFFTNPGPAFSSLGESLRSLHPVDVVVLLSGFTGAIVSGVVMKMLRRAGYQMF